MQQSTPDWSYQFENVQKIIMIGRRVQLSIGCTIMLIIIANICYKKLYIYNTTKMFMWCCVCYLIGMAVVLAHVDWFSAGYTYVYDDQYPTYINVLQVMKDQGRLYPCGLEAFINLYAYDVDIVYDRFLQLGYFFAVLVSYNVFLVLYGNYRDFVKNVFTKPKVIILLVFMFLTNLLPFVMMFVQNFNQYYTFSYAPAGMRYSIKIQKQQKSAMLLLYCGIGFNPNEISWQVVAITTHYVTSLILLIVHVKIICSNRAKTKDIPKQQYMNSKQTFLINSGKISIVVFIIQLINFSKLTLSLTLSKLNIFIIIINFIFDLYPFALAIFYYKFTRQKSGVKYGGSTILEESSFDEQ